MQQNQINNIIEMVKTSALLNVQERQEWLQLIELMNEKQLLELEKILMSHPKAKAAPVALPVTHIQLPKLNHIMNLPQHSVVQPVSRPAPAPVLTPASIATPVLKPTPAATPVFISKMKSKLDAMLAEKDLPAGEKHLSLEKGKPVVAPVVVEKPKIIEPVKILPIQKPLAPIIPIPVKLPEVKSLIIKPAEVKPPVLKLPVAKPLEQKPEVKHTFKPIFVPKVPGTEATKPKVDIANLLAHKPESPKPTPNVLRPGLQNTNMFLNVKLGEHPQAKVPVVAKVAQAVARGDTLKLVSPDDMKTLTVDTWKRQDFDSTLEQVKKLVTAFGYHQVVFILEQSALYKAYIATGLKMLQEQKTFEQVDLSPTSTQSYLNKKEFENFTDLLRNMQSA